jgi:adenine-specific DNA-methyltransferase
VLLFAKGRFDVKGFVPTPPETVDLMVELLFDSRTPRQGDRILDPGCATGAFIEGVIRWCEKRNLPIPRIVGIEIDERHALEGVSKFKRYPTVEIRHADFLDERRDQYDYIVGNPPYVAITALNEEEKSRYRTAYITARGRFDLYLLFFEQALRNLKPYGRLVFITPEKFLYVDTAAPLRALLAQKKVEEIRFLDEATFGELITYPTVSMVSSLPTNGETLVVRRDGRKVTISLPPGGASWLPLIHDRKFKDGRFRLEDICHRISCGVATGADSVFVKRTLELDSRLLRFAYPTISGRQLDHKSELATPFSMLIPYVQSGELIRERDLGALGSYLSQRQVRRRLLERTCVHRKPWYAFHETPPLEAILRPKILCKDITSQPRFWIDHRGRLVPRHSVYYIVPADPDRIEEICEHLNSSEAQDWLRAHCQRAANGFLRLQSSILKRLPIPPRLAGLSSVSGRPRNRRRFRQRQVPGQSTLNGLVWNTR